MTLSKFSSLNKWIGARSLSIPALLKQQSILPNVWTVSLTKRLTSARSTINKFNTQKINTYFLKSDTFCHTHVCTNKNSCWFFWILSLRETLFDELHSFFSSNFISINHSNTSSTFGKEKSGGTSWILFLSLNTSNSWLTEPIINKWTKIPIPEPPPVTIATLSRRDCAAVIKLKLFSSKLKLNDLWWLLSNSHDSVWFFYDSIYLQFHSVWSHGVGNLKIHESIALFHQIFILSMSDTRKLVETFIGSWRIQKNEFVSRSFKKETIRTMSLLRLSKRERIS